MDHDISVALVTRDDYLEYRYDPMSMFIVTRECEYLIDCDSAYTLGESVTFDGHIVE
jgi:hypothetical protein